MTLECRDHHRKTCFPSSDAIRDIQNFHNMVGRMLETFADPCNAEVEIGSILVSPNASSTTLAPASVCELGLTFTVHNKVNEVQMEPL